MDAGQTDWQERNRRTPGQGRMRRQRSKEFSRHDDSSSGDDNNGRFSPEDVRARNPRNVQTMNDVNRPAAGHPISSPLDNLDQAVTSLYNYLSGSEGDVDTDNPLSPLKRQERAWERQQRSHDSMMSSASSLSYTDDDAKDVAPASFTQHEYIDPSTVDRKSPLTPASPLMNQPKLPPVLPPRNPGAPRTTPRHMASSSDHSGTLHDTDSGGSAASFEPALLVKTSSGNIHFPPDISKQPLSPGQNEQMLANHLPPSPHVMSLNTHGQLGHQDIDRPPYFPGATLTNSVPLSAFSVPVRNNLRQVNHGQNRLSTGSYRFKKQRKCSWKCTAIIFIILSVVLLAVVCYLGAMMAINVNWILEGGPTESEFDSSAAGGGYVKDNSGESGFPGDRLARPVTPQTRYIPTMATGGASDVTVVFQLGNHLTQQVPANGWLKTQFQLNENTYVKFNFTLPKEAKMAVYARRHKRPTHTQYDFVELMDGDRLAGRVTRSQRFERSAERIVSGAFMQYLERGMWFLYIYNDGNDKQSVTFMSTRDDSMDSGCPGDCSGRGECDKGECICFSGYAGPDCSQSVCPVLCSSNGVYHRGECKCHPGWKGVECDIPSNQCADPMCSGRGRCIDGTCICLNGYKGENCSEVDCPSPDCTGHGMCANGTCLCYRGYRGDDCGVVDTAAMCKKECSNHGTYREDLDICICDPNWTGADCSEERCAVDCGQHGVCQNGRCQCDSGWTAPECDVRTCDPRCLHHGTCDNGTCTCHPGWNGNHCLLDGCPAGCSGHGTCKQENDQWECGCFTSWAGIGCSIPQEMECNDRVDNDNDGLTDCEDAECCSETVCQDHAMCATAPDPDEVLLRRQPPSITASFYDRTRFLVEDGSVQSYAHQSALNASRVSVIIGHVVNQHGSPVVGVRVSVMTEPLFGFTLTRQDGRYDLLVNGGGTIILQFQRTPYQTADTAVMVPWNQIVTVDAVVLTPTSAAPPALVAEHAGERCPVHDFHVMKPVVVSTWQMSHRGGCATERAVLAESQVLQERVPIPGTRLNLVYHSSKMSGYLSTLIMKLTPPTLPETLQTVVVRVEVEGVKYETTLEAEPSLKFTYAWNRRNIYRQRVYGIVTARVSVGYKYGDCNEVFWDTQTTSLSGYDIEISEIGEWDLDVHHRYNVREGILHMGDGTNVYLKDQPPTIHTMVGTGQRRSLDCSSGCSGSMHETTMMAPTALASGADGSIYVGDFNLVRRITPDGQVFTILELSTDSLPYNYYLAVHPITGELYLSNPQTRTIIKIKSLRSIRNVRENFEVAVGDKMQCLPGDKEECGDGGLAINAKLSRPKGLAFDKNGNMYFADGMTIRMVNKTEHINTIVGKRQYSGSWNRVPCSGPITFSEVQFQWPTKVAVNPIDRSVYITDENTVYMLTPDGYVKIVAGTPLHCQSEEHQLPTSGQADRIVLAPIRDMAFSPAGDLYIAETDDQFVHQIRKVSTDGKISVFAGGRSRCNCQDTTCMCYNMADASALNAAINTPSAITITPDSSVHVADLGNLRIRSIATTIPAPNKNQLYEVYHPETQEIYVFNRFGQHYFTKNIMTGKALYVFTYNVNSSYGKLSRVTDSGQNKVSIYRDYSGTVNSIETSNGQRLELALSHMGYLSTIKVGKTTMEFTYDGNTGLLTAKSSSNGEVYFYKHDENGRLSEVVLPTGKRIVLESDLDRRGSIVTLKRDDEVSETIILGPNSLEKTQGIHESRVVLLEDHSVVMETPGSITVTMEMGSHPLMDNQYSVPVKKKVTIGHDQHNRIEWRYYLRRDAKGSSQDVGQIGRRLKQNGDSMLTVEFDRETGNETLFNKEQEQLLTIKYNQAGQPVSLLPTHADWEPVILSYNSAGRLEEWRHGNVYEEYNYDRTGRLLLVRYSGNEELAYTYGDNVQPVKVTLPGGELYSISYDREGNLRQVTMPTRAVHSYQLLYSLGYVRKLYTAPQSDVAFIQDYDSDGRLLRTVYPSNQRRYVHRYDDHGWLAEIAFDSTVIKYDYDERTGLLKSVHQMSQEFDAMTDYQHVGLLTTEMVYRFGGRTLWTEARFRYAYDTSFHVTDITVELEGRQLQPLTMTYNKETGSLESVGNFRMARMGADELVVTDDQVVITRVLDDNARDKMLKYKFKNLLMHASEYKYDALGRVREVKSVVGSSSEVTITKYVYDADSQLSEVWHNDGLVWRYKYDTNGNLVGVQRHERQLGLAYNTRDEVQIAGEVVYKVDADGFVVQRGPERFQYNSRGELVYATRVGDYDVWYYYDADGRLTARRDDFGHTLQYFYADLTMPRRPTHIYNNTNSQVKVLYYDIRGSLFAIQMDDMYFYVASDHVGTPQAVLSSGLSVIKELTTAPYGEIISDSNPAFTIPIGFWGGIHDPVSKLVFIDGRPYDPVIGRWMSPDQKWEEVAADPQLANRYRFQKSNPVNKDRGGGRYLSDLESWMKVFGYDTAVVRTPVAPTPHATPADPTSLRLSSGLACSLTACGIALERYSSVPKSKVTERMHADFAPARLSAGSVFGDGILLSVADGVVVVNALPGAHKQARDVAMVILNGTLPVGLQLTIQGMDSHFLVKPPGKQVAEDLWKLSMSGDWLPLGNGMNVTKHEIGGDGGGSGGGEASYIDVRLQGAQSVINVRYGTTLAAETQRVRNYAKQWAITQAWAREQSLLHSGHFGSYHWTEAEKREILQTGAAADYSGHYLRDVGMYPQLADDCNNIVFRKRPPLDNMLSGVL